MPDYDNIFKLKFNMLNELNFCSFNILNFNL
jgi:hypothetical protein